MLLREKDKQTLLQIFAAADIRIWAYGSRVNGNAQEGSDLDLVMCSPDARPVPGNNLYKLCEKIRDSNIAILVALRDWARLPESFHKNISERYKVLFTNKGASI